TIDPQSVTEGDNLNFSVIATDPDATIPNLRAENVPPNATFVDNGGGNGTFNFNPSYIQAGTYNVRFIAFDGLLADTAIVTIDVIEAGNQAPVLAAIGSRVVDEGANLSFTVSATDVDATTPALTAENLPDNATFVDNGNGTGVFDFNPTYIQSGVYYITFIASDGALADTEIVAITVNDAGNQAPVLAYIGPRSVTEGMNLNFSISATDADATTPALTAENLPDNATFVDNGNGTGVFDFNPNYIQSGIYNVRLIASDGALADTEIVVITVNEAGNQTPVLAYIGPQTVTEGANLNFGISATDVDATIPTLTAENVPPNATFTDNGDGTGVFDFNPNYIQSGVYYVTFIASDGALADSEVVTITVNEAGNQTPVLAYIGPQTVVEGGNLYLTITATDADATTPALTAENIPANATFTDNADGTATFDFNPDYTQNGIYTVTFIASDGALADSEVVTITVNEAGNQAPVLAYIGPQAVTEGANLNFGISATDADATIPALTAENVPANATFTDNGDGTGVFDFNPDYIQSGIYNITFIASDGALADSEVVTITVAHVNLPPVAVAGPDQVNIPAGILVTLDGSGSYDPDIEPLNYSWVQIGGPVVTLSSTTDPMPTFTPAAPENYLFELTVDDNFLSSAPDTVLIIVVNGAPPVAVSDLTIQIVSDAIQLSWSAVTTDMAGYAATIDRYVIYRGTSAYFDPAPTDSIGTTDELTLSFTDNDIGGVNVVGDTLVQYFYTIVAVDIYGNRSGNSNRVGEYDYQIIITATTDYNLVGIPFANTGITDAVGLINAIGVSNVNTVNTYIPSSQSYVSRFAAGFGTNFAVTVGGVFQINAKANTIFSVAGNVPASGTVSYPIITTATTDYNFIMIPFEYENNFSLAQDVINSIPGVLNTLNNFRAESQSYISRFAAGFGTNFPVKAGKPYQANAATTGTFPQ
ncbi:MAG: Ig-like domain-containing protein, partial [candidate division Zixibacteria bacterium]|nr:Ig-like domain-containing protein [candidate division Zixibacteria bacterium]